MPSPSWPAATKRPGDGVPTPDQREVVRGRGPEADPRADRREPREPGHELERAAHHPRADPPVDRRRRRPTNSREEPSSIWPVARGCRLNATDSGEGVWALFRVSELDELVPAETRIAVRDDEVSLARPDRKAGSQQPAPPPAALTTTPASRLPFRVSTLPAEDRDGLERPRGARRPSPPRARAASAPH